ncbi:MAG: hypothetical protein M3014_00335 [Chloroflexota bacterium]|nr:hypothetical protein [Chloroflexota bacterium]
MILHSRKWRTLIRVVALIVTSVLMLAFAGPASYALQDDSPKLVTNSSQLFDKQKPIDDSYIDVKAVPDVNHAVVVKGLVATHYVIPLKGFGQQLFVRTDDPQYLFPYDYSPEQGFSGGEEVAYAGKATPLDADPEGGKISEELVRNGIVVDKNKVMVLSQGEAPRIYRPVVPVMMPLLAWLWLIALVGLVQIWRGRGPRARAKQTALAMR